MPKGGGLLGVCEVWVTYLRLGQAWVNEVPHLFLAWACTLVTVGCATGAVAAGVLAGALIAAHA